LDYHSYEDASVLVDAIGKVMTTFIHSYYPNDKAVANDREIQAWVKETVPARVHDFPKSISTRQDMIDILTHQAFLNSITRKYLSGVFDVPRLGQLRDVYHGIACSRPPIPLPRLPLQLPTYPVSKSALD
jgi:hypothetical protein